MASRNAWNEGVPVVIGPVGARVEIDHPRRRGRIRAVEQQQLSRPAAFGEQAEIRAGAVERRAQRKAPAGMLERMAQRDLAEIFPERFNNKTNGVTPRRWLLMANPGLSHVIADAIGEGWTTDGGEIAKLKPFADDPAFRHAFRRAKRDAKTQFADWLKSSSGQMVDPDSIFDCQVKRIHEYKRQMLNALRIIVLYNRLRANPDVEMTPRTFFFAGKAAPAYHLAKLIIKFLNNLAGTSMAIRRSAAD